MNNRIACGEVWLVNLDPTVGREQAKRRPCLVVSADLFNQGPGNLAVIVPITSTFRPLRWLVAIDPPEGGLTKNSYIMCHQPRVVSLLRFSDKSLGTVHPETLDEVKTRLRFLLSL